MKALVIGQSQGLSQAVASVLRVRWPDLTLVQAGETREDLELIHREQPDIVMFHFRELSEGASSADHFEFVARIRSFSDVPIVIIGQSDNVMDKVKALEMGADDWVSPSFVPMEFIAKVNAIVRRRSPSNRGAFLSLDGKLSVDYANHQVCVSGKPVKLTPIQYRLLCHLIKNQGRVCSTAELLQHVWGPNYSGERELLKLSVYRLRSKIEEDPSSPEIILNERGIGYVIRAPASSASSSQ
jgi:DNA-binding response OmpR family regulator